MSCCCGKSGCGCCCASKRGATVTFGLLGLLLSSALIAPPVYIYKTDQDYTKMFPMFKYGRQYLAMIAGGDPVLERAQTTTLTSTSLEVNDDEPQGTILDEEEKHSQTYK